MNRLLKIIINKIYFPKQAIKVNHTANQQQQQRQRQQQRIVLVNVIRTQWHNQQPTNQPTNHYRTEYRHLK